MAEAPKGLNSPVALAVTKYMARAQTWLYRRTGGRIGATHRLGAGFRKPVPTLLLDHVGPRAIHSMYDLGSARYDALVRANPPIGIVHLGLGPDGHTASLFPGTAVVDERERFVVENEDDLHPHPRITFTFPAIERSELVIVTVAGAESPWPSLATYVNESTPTKPGAGV